MKPAERLKRIRENLDFSQRELAREFGVSPGAIALWETGARSIPGPVVKLIEIYEQHLSDGDSRISPEQLNDISRRWAKKILTPKAPGSSSAEAAPRLRDAIFKYLETSLEPDQVRRRIQLSVISRIVESLGEIKGLPMKVAQLASFMDVNMSPELKEMLASLQTMATPLPSGVAARVIYDEFGVLPTKLFAEWSPKPFAVASIGQVHLARLPSGEQVAVKVQHPEIRDKMNASFKKLSIVQHLASFWKLGDRAVFEDLRKKVLEECDYLQEAENQERFRELFSKEGAIIVPKVFRNYTRRTVLTSEYVPGRTFQEFLKHASQEQKNRAAEVITRFHSLAIMKYGFMQADPHPGNYIFQDDKIAFIDFGRLVHYDANSLELNRRFALSVLMGDHRETKATIEALGLVRDPADFDFEQFYHLLRRQEAHHLSEIPFQITREYVAQTNQAMKNYSGKKSLKITPTFFWCIFINQSLLHILAELNATSDWRSAALKVNQEAAQIETA